MLREMRTRGIDVPVIMFSTLTHHGARETIEGLALGAADYVTKPTHYDSPIDALEAVRAELVPRIKAIVAATRAASAAPQAARSADEVLAIDKIAGAIVRLAALGTGFRRSPSTLTTGA